MCFVYCKSLHSVCRYSYYFESELVSPFALSLSKGYLLKGERCGFTSFDKLRTNGPLLARSVNWKMKDAHSGSAFPCLAISSIG